MKKIKNLDDQVKWLILKDIPGLGPFRIKKLYDEFSNIDNIIDCLLEAKGNKKYKNKAKELIKNIDNKNEYYKYENKINELIKNKGEIVTIDNNCYPTNLKATKNPPPVLFYKGSLSKLKKKALAVVGTTNPTKMGEKRALYFAKLCAENNIQIISGLARGIDTKAHQGALKYGIETYAVIGHGLDHVYPPENKELYSRIEDKGAIISQFEIGVAPKKWTFPQRNEVMCSLASGTVIIEAEEGCGSIIQAKFSFKHNRPVFILKNNLMKEDNEWAEKLVEEGAIVIEDFETVIDKLGYKKKTNNNGNKEQLNLFKKKQENAGAILFDLDGVIFDAKKIMVKSYKNVINEIKGENVFMNVNEDKLNKFLTESPYKVFREFEVNPNNAYRIYKKYYTKLIEEEGSSFDNVIEILKRLKQKNYYMGIVTSQPRKRLDIILKKLSIDKLFNTTISWNDIPKGKNKPEPDGINKALERLNVDKNYSIYVGDTRKDIKAAKNAGIASVFVTWGFGKKDEIKDLDPDIIADDVFDIYKVENYIKSRN